MVLYRGISVVEQSQFFEFLEFLLLFSNSFFQATSALKSNTTGRSFQLSMK